jgi:light-regulated signal transduction histidine kinase (bacteriophytochrome)
MHTIVSTVVNDLMDHDQERMVSVTIRELNECPADLAMIRQVWTNLISNAIKYTSKKENPHIEVSSYLKDGMAIYSVRDNGAGFDMQYVSKLFGVFQRLHRIQDFEGTGVGLAIVYRIISKHGGKVWAEGKINEGATFSFALPLKNRSINS